MIRADCLRLQHVELDEAAGEDGERPDDAHGHKHAEQDVVQNHGDELPLLRRLAGREEEDGELLIQTVSFHV